VPAGTQLLGVSASVIVAAEDNAIVDAGARALANMPVGYTASWSVGEDPGDLDPPVAITGGTGGRIFVTFTVQP
jgi:hypothetical protein